MNPTVVGVVVFGSSFGGVLLGMWLRRVFPDHHFDAESKDTIKLGIGLVATMTALVLGLVTASAKNSFDTVDSAVKQSAVEVLTLDRVLARYGPEAGHIRAGLQQAVRARIDMIWPQGASKPAKLDPLQSGLGEVGAENIIEAIRQLKPVDNAQRALQSRALDLGESLLQARWLVMAGSEASIPLPFLVILLFWLTVTFTSFGLFAPRNTVVHAVLFVCALSVGSAVFLVMEMDQPFEGLLRVSADPLHYAYEHLNR